MRPSITLVLAASLAACSGATPPPGSAGDAAQAGAVQAGAAASNDCLASTTRARPEGWVDAGELVVSVANGRPTSIEVHDASGKVVKTAPVDNTSPETMRESIRVAVCDAGGYLGVMSGRPPVTGTTRIQVVRPEKEDEDADLRLLCAEPQDIPADFDLSQKVVIARQIYEEALTSKRYRGWLARMDRAVKADDRAARLRLVEELSGQAKGAEKASCWFPDTMKKGTAAPP